MVPLWHPQYVLPAETVTLVRRLVADFMAQVKVLDGGVPHELPDVVYAELYPFTLAYCAPARAALPTSIQLHRAVPKT